MHIIMYNDVLLCRYALSISYVADGARLLQSEGHIRYPDNEDHMVREVVGE